MQCGSAPKACGSVTQTGGSLAFSASLSTGGRAVWEGLQYTQGSWGAAVGTATPHCEHRPHRTADVRTPPSRGSQHHGHAPTRLCRRAAPAQMQLGIYFGDHHRPTAAVGPDITPQGGSCPRSPGKPSGGPSPELAWLLAGPASGSIMASGPSVLGKSLNLWGLKFPLL